MIARPKTDTTSLRSGDLDEAFQQVAQQAASLTDSFARLQQGLDQAADVWTKPPPLPPPGLADTADLAARVNQAARQVSDSSNLPAINESLTNALTLMNEIAAQAASQSELREIASQVETLRDTVNNLASRVSANRLP